MRQVQGMGPLESLIGMLPGVNAKALQEAKQVDPKRIKHLEAIVLSMTPEERQRPEVLNGSRRARVPRACRSCRMTIRARSSAQAFAHSAVACASSR